MGGGGGRGLRYSFVETPQYGNAMKPPSRTPEAAGPMVGDVGVWRAMVGVHLMPTKLALQAQAAYAAV